MVGLKLNSTGQKLKVRQETGNRNVSLFDPAAQSTVNHEKGLYKLWEHVGSHLSKIFYFSQTLSLDTLYAFVLHNLISFTFKAVSALHT